MNKLDSESIKIIEAKHHDPFSVLGRHPYDKLINVKVYLPYAESVSFANGGPDIPRISGSDFFEYTAQQNELPEHYQLDWIDKDGSKHTNYDPYDFGVQLPEFDRHLFAEGKHWHIYQKMGAHQHTVDNIDGVLFTVWAPNAGRVSVIGDFNRWDGRCNPMRSLGWQWYLGAVYTGTYRRLFIQI